MTESELQILVANYLRLQYPDVLFRSDFGSGAKLTPGQAIRQKRQNGGRRAWPDLFIAEPVDVDYGEPSWRKYSGLFLELKKEGTRIKKRNGEWASNHIREQAEILEILNKKHYKAEFAVGFNEARKQIDSYLGGKNVI